MSDHRRARSIRGTQTPADGQHINRSLNERVISTRLLSPRARANKSIEQLTDAEIDAILALPDMEEE
jgi:hypothetical protein